jgi:aminomethyltransferase
VRDQPAAVIRTTPFHERTSALNQTQLWSHWSNFLAADRYQLSDKAEYFAVRNAAGIFDSSPLYKYRITGPDADTFLAGVLARDVRACRQACAQYVLARRSRLRRRGRRRPPSKRTSTSDSAEPNFAWFADRIGAWTSVQEVSDEIGPRPPGPALAGPAAKLVPQ